jgi:hypothetical protein
VCQSNTWQDRVAECKHVTTLRADTSITAHCASPSSDEECRPHIVDRHIAAQQNTGYCGRAVVCCLHDAYTATCAMYSLQQVCQQASQQVSQ